MTKAASGRRTPRRCYYPAVPNYMIVAGEPSADAHAAALVTALRANGSGFNFFGATGPLMRAAGVETIVNSDDLAIMGIPVTLIIWRKASNPERLVILIDDGVVRRRDMRDPDTR